MHLSPHESRESRIGGFFHSRVAARSIGIFLASLLVRVLFVLDFTAQPLFDVNLAAGTDMQTLVQLARRISGGDVLARGTGPYWWAPLFPYALAGFFSLGGPDNIAGAAFVQAILGALTCVLLYLLGRQLFSESVGLVAGGMAALYGPAIFYTGILLSTTLEVFLSVSILLTVTQARSCPSVFRWLIAGAVTGLGCLARPNFLLPALLLWVLLPLLLRNPAGRVDWRTVRRAAVAFPIGSLLIILPVTARNVAVGGQVVLISAAGPETYRIGNSYDSTPLNFVYPTKPPMPFTSAAFWQHQARKALLFWWGFEPPQNVNYYLARQVSPVLGLPWLPFWIVVPLAAVGLWVTRPMWRRLLHVYTFLSAYYLSVVAFFVIARWRLPLLVPLLCFSAAGLLALVRWARFRRWRPVGIATIVLTGLIVLIHPGDRSLIFPADYGQLGYILANHRQYGEAAALLQRAAAGFPANGAIHRDLGLLLRLQGRSQEAQAPLERAAVLLPNDAGVHLALGSLLAELDADPVRARHHLTKALALSPEGPRATEAAEALERLDAARPRGRSVW